MAIAAEPSGKTMKQPEQQIGRHVKKQPQKRKLLSFKDFVKQRPEPAPIAPSDSEPDAALVKGGDGILLPADFFR